MIVLCIFLIPFKRNLHSGFLVLCTKRNIAIDIFIHKCYTEIEPYLVMREGNWSRSSPNQESVLFSFGSTYRISDVSMIFCAFFKDAQDDS